MEYFGIMTYGEKLSLATRVYHQGSHRFFAGTDNYALTSGPFEYYLTDGNELEISGSDTHPTHPNTVIKTFKLRRKLY